MNIDDFFTEQANLDAAGKLTAGKAMIGCYYRLLEKEHANRVIIKAGERIDGKEVARFANSLTWIYVDSIKDVLCESTCPSFPGSRNKVDISQASWYPDNSDQKQHYIW